MDLTRTSRWLGPLAVLLAGVIVLTGWDLGPWANLGVGAVALLVAWWASPLRRGGASHAEASAHASQQDAVVVYWRPGCQYCLRLRLALGRRRREALWVNIWSDAEAAAYVRGVNAGNETVPTVLVGDEAWTNPSPGRVREALAARAPA